jgi:hypothetical protein
MNRLGNGEWQRALRYWINWTVLVIVTMWIVTRWQTALIGLAEWSCLPYLILFAAALWYPRSAPWQIVVSSAAVFIGLRLVFDIRSELAEPRAGFGYLGGPLLAAGLVALLVFIGGLLGRLWIGRLLILVWTGLKRQPGSAGLRGSLEARIHGLSVEQREAIRRWVQTGQRSYAITQTQRMLGITDGAAALVVDSLEK